MMNCIFNKKTDKNEKYPFASQFDGFYKICLVGYHSDAQATAFDISTYLECSTMVIASPSIDKLPCDYTYSRVKKVIFVKSRELSDIKKVIDVEHSAGNNVVTIYEVTDDTDNINLPGNLICIYDSYIPTSIYLHNIVVSKLCSNKIRKKIHKYCWLSRIKLLGFDTWSSQLSNISDNNVMVLNSIGVYECNFMWGLAGSLVELDVYDFKITSVAEAFDKIDKSSKSIVFCGKRESGIVSTLLTYIKQAGTRYDKCMFACTDRNELKDRVIKTGCSFLVKPDINEIVNFVKAEGSKLLVFDDDCAQDKHLLKLYSTLVCNRDLFNLTVVMMCQYANSKITKLNHDHFVMSNPTNMSDHKRLYRLIGNYYPSCDLFKRDLEQMGEDYNAMVVNNVDKKNYKDKTFSTNADDYVLLKDLDVKFTPHELVNEELSVTYVKKEEVIDVVTEPNEEEVYFDAVTESNDLYNLELINYPHTLILGNLDRCFKVFKSYTGCINNKNNLHDKKEYSYIVENHVFVSPETDSKMIEELDAANYCVHYGYNIDEFDELMYRHLGDSDNTFINALHICIITSVLSECTRSFFKSKSVQKIIHNGRHFNRCVTVIDPTGKSITESDVVNNFDIVVASYVSDLKINAYFPTLSGKQFTDMLDEIYCDDESELKVVVSSNQGNKKVRVLKINDTPLHKFSDVLMCDRKITNRLDACFANLSKLSESNIVSE